MWCSQLDSLKSFSIRVGGCSNFLACLPLRAPPPLCQLRLEHDSLQSLGCWLGSFNLGEPLSSEVHDADHAGYIYLLPCVLMRDSPCSPVPSPSFMSGSNRLLSNLSTTFVRVPAGIASPVSEYQDLGP